MSKHAILRCASGGAILLVLATAAEAQQQLPTIQIGNQKHRASEQARTASARVSGGPRVASSSRPRLAREAAPAAGAGQASPSEPALFTRGGGSLVAPSIPTLRAELKRNVGSVGFVDSNTPEQQTRYIADLRDALKDAPGVFAESVTARSSVSRCAAPI